MLRRVGVPPWHRRQLPGCNAWPKHLKYFLVKVPTTVCVIQMCLGGHFDAWRYRFSMWGSVLMHCRRSVARGCLLTNRAVAVSVRCFACRLCRGADHALGVSVAPWVLCFKIWADDSDERDGNS